MYSFEGINLVLPVEAAMKKPEHFLAVYIVAKVIIVLTFTLFSIMCVSAFGKVDDGSINAFLTKHAQNYNGVSLVLVANIIVSFSVLFSYPLQLFPCIISLGQDRFRRSQQRGDVLPLNEAKPTSPLLSTRTTSKNNPHSLTDSTQDLPDQAQNNTVNRIQKGEHLSSMSGVDGDSPVLRTILVLLTFLAAIAVPNVQELISLAGAFAGTSMALIIPPLIKLSVVSGEHANLEKLRYWSLVIFGSFLGISGTLASVIEIYNSYVD